jgi:hypothetical protein
MLPPWPPSPPLGPPLGTYFSRRNATQPFPPGPAFTWILASSTNTSFYPRDSIRAKNTKATPRVWGRHRVGCKSKRQFAGVATEAASASGGITLMKRPLLPLS